MIAMRDEGLIGGVGLSNVTLDQFEHAAARTEIACVQNPFNLVDRAAMPLLRALPSSAASRSCRSSRSARRSARASRVLDAPGGVAPRRERLGATPAQVALAWLARARAEHRC